MFTKIMYWIVEQIAYFHNQISLWNNGFLLGLNDKELHFVVIGVVGLLLTFVIYPLFKYLAKRDLVMVITWVYVFTCIIVLTFMIEIGQGYTHTGAVEMADVVAGLAGFICMFAIFAILRAIVLAIYRHFAH